MDSGSHHAHTRDNILEAYQAMVEAAEPGDALFCHYSGHGAKVRDTLGGDKADGYHETLVPVHACSHCDERRQRRFANAPCIDRLVTMNRT